MECRLPVDKIVKIRNALNKTYNRKKIKLRDLQSLIGLLNFACLVVSPGRAFLRRLIDLTIKVFNPFHWIKLTCEARADILAWKCFIESFNGQSMFLPDHWVSSDHLRLYTDASGNFGYGAVFWQLVVCKLMAKTVNVLLHCSEKTFPNCYCSRNMGTIHKKFKNSIPF